MTTWETSAGPAGGWRPANEVERMLAGALLDEDLDSFVRLLAAAPLYLPGFADPDRVLYSDHDGQRHLVAFTSVEELYASVGEQAAGWRGTSLVELVRAWPEPSWGLAVDPAAPISVFIPPDRIAELPLPDEPPLSPRDETERLLHEALLVEDLPAMLDVLVTARVGVATAGRGVGGADPGWLVEDLAGVPTVVVYTADRHPGPATTEDFVTVLSRWPSAARQLAVNPGTSLGMRFPDQRVDDLLRFAEARAATVPPPAADPRVSEDVPPPATDPPVPGEGKPVVPEVNAISDVLRGR